MTKELYEYQTIAYDKWLTTGYRAIIQAPTASGKTLMGINCLKRYRLDNPSSKIMIVTPSSKVASQWEKDCREYRLDVPITTYAKAINQFYRGGLTADCLLLDECHRASPEKQSSAILKLNPMHILGLSATPGNSVKNVGPICYKVGWDKANICPFTVHYAMYEPTEAEMDRYKMWSTKMVQTASEYGMTHLPPGRSPKYDMFVRNRRACCYTFRSRLVNAIQLITAYKDRRTVVFFERNEQIKEISDMLKAQGIPHAICSQLQDNLIDYETHRCNILLLAKKLREGYNDPTIDTVLLIAPTTRALSHTQIVGRALRLNPEDPAKNATIIALIANGTSDTQLIRNNQFPKENIDITDVPSILALTPGISKVRKAGLTTLENWT